MSDNARIRQVLEQMLGSDCSPEEACAGDADLLQEVRLRWERVQRVREQVESLFPTAGAGPGPSGPPDKLPHLVGYHLECVLGQGGMGVVYQARHLKLNRRVALKMLLAGPFAGHEGIARFMREAEAVAALRHPNIVQVHESGELDGLPFFTMELVEGGSLAQKLAGQPQPARQAAEVVATLAGAVQFAHARGIIHRDLKPANILLTADGAPKITDFGLARVAGGPEFTLSGAVLGTPSYMAPEQALGKASAIGPAVDVYALGAILYELLTGRPPFRAETAAETERQVIAEEPAPPSRLNARVPRDLETICLKCLHKSPARRYASAGELVEDLHRFLEGKPVHARPVGAAERAVKWARRRPAAALLIAALLVLVGAGTGLGLWLRQQAMSRQEARAQREGQARAAVEDALKRADDLRKDERWTEALLVLAEASTHLSEAGSPLLKERLEQAQSDFRIAADLERARESGPLQPTGAPDYAERATEYREAFARARLQIDDDLEKVAASIQASAIREQLVAAIDDRALVAFMVDDGPLVERLLRIARLADPGASWRDRFRDPGAWRSREQLLRLAGDAFNTSPPLSGHQLALLGLLLRRQGAWPQSTALLCEACRRQPNNFWLNREAGAALSAEERFPESAAYLRAALALRPNNAGVHMKLGMVLFHAGQIDQAFAESRRAVELSPRRASPRVWLVRALAEVGRWTEAETECRPALGLVPPSHLPHLNLALVLSTHHRDEAALVMFRKARALAPHTHHTHFHLGVHFGQMGRHDEAVTALRKATELAPAERAARLLLASELAAAGRRPEAIALLQNEAARGPAHTWVLLKLGQLLRADGRPEEAARAFERLAAHEPRMIHGWEGLAAARLDQGHFNEARAATKRLLALPLGEAQRREQQRQIALCDSLLAVAPRLPAILDGRDRPADIATQRAVAEWCLKHKRRPVTAAALYSSALSAQPSLADDLEAGNRFHAACAAVRASGKLDDRRRSALRKQALDWLTVEHDAWAERHRLGKPKDRTVIAWALRSWLGNEDLAGVRDEQALARLPLDERRAWQALWDRVKTLAARDPVALVERARAHVARVEWKRAAKCYAEGLELGATDSGDLLFEHAAAQLLAGDRPGYRRTCGQMLARCPSPGMQPYLVARACTLAPDSTDDWEHLSWLAHDDLTRNASKFSSLTERGALFVRAGRLREAAVPLEASLAADGRPGRAVLNWLWLALVAQKTGKPDEARRWLARATEWLDEQGGRMPLDTRAMGLHRHNWLEAHVLRREVEALLR
jgi:serine/threonine-protein kinase